MLVNLKSFFAHEMFGEFKTVKIVRHKDAKKYEIQQLADSGDIELYQAFQAKDIFNKCTHILVFIGGHSTLSTFYNAYKVISSKPSKDVILSDPKYESFRDGSTIWYELERISDFEDLSGRLVIDWGNSALAWHQWFNVDGVKIEKEVIELLPSDNHAPFPGYMQISLHYSKLQLIRRHPERYKSWINALSNVLGIYLILNEDTGKQYIGKASGKNGIWGRWKEYATNGHGGNIELEAEIENAGKVPNYRYSILYTAPLNATELEIYNAENLFKLKLGSKTHGLNSN